MVKLLTLSENSLKLAKISRNQIFSTYIISQPASLTGIGVWETNLTTQSCSSVRFVDVFTKTCRGYRTYHIRARILMIVIETNNGQFLMKVTKSAVSTRLYATVWCIFYNCFSTEIYKDLIFVDAQKLEAKERDL